MTLHDGRAIQVDIENRFRDEVMDYLMELAEAATAGTHGLPARATWVDSPYTSKGSTKEAPRSTIVIL